VTKNAAGISASLNEEARVRLGAGPDTAPPLLAGLARDPAVTVRAALALNASAPPDVDAILAEDSDERVRGLLAHKLATLAPSLSAAAQTRLQRQAYQTLLALVADEAERVRAAISAVVKEMPDAPRDLVLRLCHDTSASVSEPVIRLSPLLNTEDLLALIACSPSPATVRAVARRQGIEEPVSDAIAATADAEAIGALLANKSAQIRETTLDMLIARAVQHTEWHEPLVNRPHLSPHAARALSGIVATHLLGMLAARGDLDQNLAAELRIKLEQRLSAADQQEARTERTPAEAMHAAHALAADDGLTEDALLNAAQQGDVPLASALLAVAASMPLSVVERAASLRSAKGIVSLAWRAGFSMRAAVALQSVVARLAPDAILSAAPGGSFPLAPDEMRWQIDFLARMGR
jgi:uncharacterized protein (DUF2336 family)